MPAQHLPQLLEGPLGLLGGVGGCGLDLEHVPAGDKLHPKGVADRPEELVPRAEEDHGLLPAIEGQVAGHRRISHCRVLINATDQHRRHRSETREFKSGDSHSVFSDLWSLCFICGYITNHRYAIGAAKRTESITSSRPPNPGMLCAASLV